MLKTVKGVVLREVDIGDYDKMLTVLTAEQGRISIFANGVKRLKSPHFVATQLYTYSEFTLYGSRDKYYIRECSKIESFFGLRDTLESLSLAAYIAEIACDVSLEEQAEDMLLRLVLNSFFCISQKSKRFCTAVRRTSRLSRKSCFSRSIEENSSSGSLTSA